MKTTPMLPALLLVPLILCLPGCLFLAGAAVAAGVAGVVVATSEDTARVDVRGEVDAVFQTALKRVEKGGAVTYADPHRGLIEGKVEGSKVKMRVFLVGELVRVTVSARKIAGAFPDRSLAEMIAADVSRVHS